MIIGNLCKIDNDAWRCFFTLRKPDNDSTLIIVRMIGIKIVIFIAIGILIVYSNGNSTGNSNNDNNDDDVVWVG